uniref:Uncharacterized protein n=1 Tax=Echinococcus granulosus TaxID=6210 RepID=A0A068X0U0_ECHGR|nr:hypothetical protein EgrG_000572000 [Echinococcus granulosus]
MTLGSSYCVLKKRKKEDYLIHAPTFIIAFRFPHSPLFTSV